MAPKNYFEAADVRRMMAEYPLGDAFMEIIKENGGSINCGDSRYYIGEKKKIKPKDNWSVMEALLEHTEGDAEQIAGCLASSAWKQGGFKTLL